MEKGTIDFDSISCTISDEAVIVAGSGKKQLTQDIQQFLAHSALHVHAALSQVISFCKRNGRAASPRGRSV
ncbi:hypothetical protein GOB94_14515 [Granulicella sp. 5B5]|uniref:hypothetical protein n=1 Tax=Granulicella sp. 5B5 TaxID=1617967 RepID=UPI0015F757E0|nr:hypothetical protein [Granulicella sp. 5B5]QMV19771.1 hypothetical protein GOB94_14515 [Granulicella sp. 5B5]